MNTHSHPTIALLQTNSLASAVQQAIEQAILSGEFAPGSKLVEAALAERLGVSRGPIREAFRMLDEIGLVYTEKNRGVFVRDMSLREAAEIFDVRAALEEMVGRQLAVSIRPEQLQEINQLLDAMTQAVAGQDANQYHLLNLQFHDRLVEMTANRRLQGIYRKLTKELSLFRRRNLGGSGVLPLSEQGHRQIVSAIASGNAEVAGRAMAAHVLGSKQRSLGGEPADGHTTATVPGNTALPSTPT